MNDREHSREAERLLFDAAKEGSTKRGQDNFDLVHAAIAMAQVHATLALYVALREVGDQLDTLPRHVPAQGEEPSC